jgi:GT2 family glycosyltransferase
VSLLLFWSSVAVISYTYVVYPVLIVVRGRLAPRPYRCEDVEPTITVVIAAHNEADVIGARLDNLLACDYPRTRREILVASDGSDDATVEIAGRYADAGVRVLDLPRGGKVAALNAACRVASGEVLVFTDANTVFATDSLRAIVRPLADPRVGGVAGDQRYLTDPEDLGTGSGERQYWDLDRRLKVAQSRAGSVISATGALYALRRELYQPIPAGVTDDFHASTAAVAHGYRLVFATDAAAYEAAAPSAMLEFGRKVRVITQGLRAIAVRRSLLDPRRTGFYAVQLWSHKVLRRVMVVPLLALLVSAPLSFGRGLAYQVATVGQAAVYLAALVGIVWSATRWRLPRPFALPMYFVLVNAACLAAMINLARGRRIDRWQPQRTTSDREQTGGIAVSGLGERSGPPG